MLAVPFASVAVLQMFAVLRKYAGLWLDGLLCWVILLATAVGDG